MTSETVNETCDECGFDASRWTHQDAIETVWMAGHLAKVAADVDDTIANTRPDAATWSIGEYVDHVSDVFALIGQGAQLAVASPGTTVDTPEGPEFDPVARHVDLHAALDRLMAEGAESAALFRAIQAEDLDAQIHVGSDTWTPRRLVLHLCHDLTHHLMDIGRIRSGLEPSIDMAGTISQVSASGGGVPKLSIESAEIDAHGVVGDVQAARKHHGRPWQAICMYSADVIAALRDEGHPIGAGSAGENITISGVDWSAMRPGLTVTIGEVVLRVSAPAVPCSKNNRWFNDGDSNRISHDLHPGWSRWYADVVTPGSVRSGDAVTVASGA